MYRLCDNSQNLILSLKAVVSFKEQLLYIQGAIFSAKTATSSRKIFFQPRLYCRCHSLMIYGHLDRYRTYECGQASHKEILLYHSTFGNL